MDDLRWTDGNAGLPGQLFNGFSGSVELILWMAATTRYLADDLYARAA
jgi:hypothetical protein